MDEIARERQSDASGVSTAEPNDLKEGKGHAEHVPRGILCMVIATMLFSIAFALSKWQVGIYPPGEVVFLRSLSSLIVAAAVMLPVTTVFTLTPAVAVALPPGPMPVKV